MLLKFTIGTATNKTLTEFAVKTDVEGQLMRWTECLRVFITFIFVTHTHLGCITETRVRNRVSLLAESNVEQGSSVAVRSGVANRNCKYCVSVTGSSSDIYQFSVRTHPDYIMFVRCNLAW